MLSHLSRASSAMKTYCFDRKFFNSSTPLLPVQLPSRTETHFWYILPDEVNNSSLLNQYLELLSPCEKENVFRMRGEELKKRALLARALVRTTIARYQINSEVSARSLKFIKNIHGKPEVLWPNSEDWHPPPLQFNLSHTSSLIACGVTLNSSIGIDVEEKQRTIKNNLLSFARRYLTKYEVEVLAAISDPEVQRQEFIKLWTLKEAYVKALGRGFSGAPFKTFTIRYKSPAGETFDNCKSLDSEATEIMVDSSVKESIITRNWQFAAFELAGSHYAAVCRAPAAEGEENNAMKLTVRKTIPFVEDKYVSGTDAVVRILEVFPAADVDNELNPGVQNENLVVDLDSFHVAPSKDIEEQAEVAAKSQKEKESEKKDSLQSLKSAVIVSGVIVAVIGALFALTKKLKEK